MARAVAPSSNMQLERQGSQHHMNKRWYCRTLLPNASPIAATSWGGELLDVAVGDGLGHLAKQFELGQREKVSDRAIRWHHGVVPAVVLDQLAAAVDERPDVRARGGRHRREDCLRVVVDRREVDLVSPHIQGPV